MIRHIYIEEQIMDHSRTREICARFPAAKVVVCQHYAEVFNVAGQNFRLQKRQPSLILASKSGKRVLQTPDGYGIGGEQNYYFSHMLNCLYDCRYCFLQGMYRSAHYVVFVNYEDFIDDIRSLTAQQGDQRTWFFSGYDCDSMAMEPVTGFMDTALPAFAQIPQASLEIRTKSTQIRSLLSRPALPNCVVAFSFTPDAISRALEHKVPSIEKRLRAIQRLQEHGWQIGLRLDPLIYSSAFREQYTQLLAQLFAFIDPLRLHSVSVGEFRLPNDFFKKMVRIYPAEKLFAGPLERRDGMVSYPSSIEAQLRDCVLEQLHRYTSADKIHLCG